MNEIKKTIFMTRAQWETWKNALLSGKYRQGAGSLHADNGYCCLGVLEDALTGEVESTGLPSKYWLDAHNIQFTMATGYPQQAPFVLTDFRDSLSYHRVDILNDNGWSFEKIVEVMEPHVQFTDETGND